MNIQHLITDLPPLLQEYADNILNSVQPIISFSLCKTQPSLWDSKIGGAPYLPKDYPYPQNSQGIKMQLLAQFNLAQLPQSDKLPPQGMLQFFVVPDDTAGRNYQYEANAKDGYCVIYHENVIEDAAQLQTAPPLEIDDYFCLKGEYGLHFKMQYQPITSNDIQFYRRIFNLSDSEANQFILDLEEKHNIDFFEEIIEPYDDFINRVLENDGHQLFGYPCFTDGDFRENIAKNHAEKYAEYELLLQLDSDKEEDNYRIIWGDCGVAQFFIHPEDLKKRDFSQVIYDWYS